MRFAPPDLDSAPVPLMTPEIVAKSRPVLPLSLTFKSCQPPPEIVAVAGAVVVMLWLRVSCVAVLKPVM